MRLTKLLNQKRKNLLSIYCTAGYPSRDVLPSILDALEEVGVDFVEVGIPYSDPLADGPTIQESSSIALQNGISIDLIFEQLASYDGNMPLVMMSYLNPVLQYGMERFLKRCVEAGVSGVILPDLPPEIYQKQYQELFEQTGISNIFLMSPQTSPERLRLIDSLSSSFIYAVSSASTTGKQQGLEESGYLKGLKNLGLNHPVMVGFNISTAADLALVHRHAAGGIIGSAFIKEIARYSDLLHVTCGNFIQSLKYKNL
ncbi:MAG: tryptophan synthase subunit alpha [Bacteroidia bacterium]